MQSSKVMLRISSWQSFACMTAPSIRWRTPWVRITGGTPTRGCNSDASPETINCDNSDMAYIDQPFIFHLVLRNDIHGWPGVGSWSGGSHLSYGALRQRRAGPCTASLSWRVVCRRNNTSSPPQPPKPGGLNRLLRKITAARSFRPFPARPAKKPDGLAYGATVV